MLHEGGSKGVSTIVVLLPVSKRGIIVFTNGDKGDIVYSRIVEEFLDTGKDIMYYLTQMSYDPEQIKTVAVPDDILSTYTGSYLVPSFQMSVKIIYEDNLLKLESPYSTMVLYPETETKFFLKADDLRIEFINDENKKTIGMMVTYQGGEPELTQ